MFAELNRVKEAGTHREKRGREGILHTHRWKCTYSVRRRCAGSLAQRRHLPYSKLVFDISFKLPTVFTSHTRRENTAGCTLPGNPLENV